MTDKVKVSTTGNFMLLDPTTGEVIESYGATEVTRSAWVEAQLESGKLTTSAKPKAEEPAEAEDKELLTPAVQNSKVKT